jgi:hypothetical protein
MPARQLSTGQGRVHPARLHPARLHPARAAASDIVSGGAPLRCRFSACGCGFSATTSDELTAHHSTNKQHHIDLMASALATRSLEIANLREQLSNGERQIRGVQSLLAEVEDSVSNTANAVGGASSGNSAMMPFDLTDPEGLGTWVGSCAAVVRAHARPVHALRVCLPVARQTANFAARCEACVAYRAPDDHRRLRGTGRGVSHGCAVRPPPMHTVRVRVH